MIRCQGPECPRCGCQQAETVDSYVKITWHRGVPVDEETELLLECGHCGKEFRAQAAKTNGQFPDADEVPLPVLRCPTCGSKDTFVTSTRTGGKRYHRCRACHTNFKSKELA